MIVRLLLHSLFLLQCLQVNAVPTNRTIDDTFGDSVTGSTPIYLPDGNWDDTNCSPSHCTVLPPSGQAFKHTWRAATYLPNGGARTAQLSFKGTDIYVFFILANNVPNAGTETHCKFLIDGQVVGSFDHSPSQSPDYQYNALVFSRHKLSNTDHTLLISADGYDTLSFINFDYAIYTYDDGSSPAPAHTPTSQTSPQSPNADTTVPQIPPSLHTVTTIISGTTIVTEVSTTSDFPQIPTPSGTASDITPTAAIISGTKTGIAAGATRASSTNSLSAATNSSASDTNNTITHKLPVGAVVGGVVGGILLLILILILLLCMRRRRQRISQVSSTAPSTAAEPVLVPFTSFPALQTNAVPAESEPLIIPDRKRRDIVHSPTPPSSDTHQSRSTGQSRGTHVAGSSISASSRFGGSDVTEIVEQNLVMKAQIEHLQAQLNTAQDQAVGIISDPPPGYTRRVASDLNILSPPVVM